MGDDISPEVDEVTAEFGEGVVLYPASNRIPYEYKIVDCETGREIGVSTGAPSPPVLAPSAFPTSAPIPQPIQPAPTTIPVGQQTCTPIGECGAYSWCDQDTYVGWCEEQALTGACPVPFCKLTQITRPATMPEFVGAPAPTTSQPLDGVCVPTGEGLYTSKQTYDPICKVLTDTSTCAAYPMCKWKSSLVSVDATRVRLRATSRHRPLVGNALIQEET